LRGVPGYELIDLNHGGAADAQTQLLHFPGISKDRRVRQTPP